MLQPLEVLVVDDIKLNRDVTGIMLKKLGHKVDFAEDGREAVMKNSLKK